MSDTRHTPGPWVADIRSGSIAVYPAGQNRECLMSADQWAVCYMAGRGAEVRRADANYEGWCLLTDEQKANARLIAAAPEMYEILNGLFPRFPTGVFAVSSNCMDAQIVKARALLARLDANDTPADAKGA